MYNVPEFVYMCSWFLKVPWYDAYPVCISWYRICVPWYPGARVCHTPDTDAEIGHILVSTVEEQITQLSTIVTEIGVGPTLF